MNSTSTNDPFAFVDAVAIYPLRDLIADGSGTDVATFTAILEKLRTLVASFPAEQQSELTYLLDSLNDAAFEMTIGAAEKGRRVGAAIECLRRAAGKTA